MSQQTATFEVSNPFARIHNAIHSLVPFVPIAVSMLGLLALVTYAIIAVGAHSVPLANFMPAPAFGLMPHNADDTVPPATSGTAFLAANPEVRHFLNHTAVTAAQSFMDANPELRLFLNHAPAAVPTSEQSFFDANPELRLFLNHAGSAQAAEDAFFAANPEAGTMLRFAATQSH